MLGKGRDIKGRRTDIKKIRLDESAFLGDVLHRFHDRDERVKMPATSPAHLWLKQRDACFGILVEAALKEKEYKQKMKARYGESS